MNSILLVVIIILFLANFIHAFIPHWTRKTESFGVSIPEHLYKRTDFKTMRNKYTIVISIINIILFVFMMTMINSLSESMLITAIITYSLFIIVIGFVYYLKFHNKMKQIKAAEKWSERKDEILIVDTSFSQERLVYSNKWFLIPFAIVLFTIGYTFYVYDDIPNEVPIHTSASGEVTYEEKSVNVMLLMPILQLFFIGMFIFINYIIKRSKQQVNVQNPEISRKQNIKFRKRWSLFMIITTILMTLLFSFSQFTFIYPSLRTYDDMVIMTVIGFILIGSILLAFISGQGGSRIKIDGKKDTTRIELDEDKHWKLGQFYVNKDDPSIFVEKRFGIGWTNNWAHPISWILVISLIVLPLVIIFLLL